MSHKDLYRGVRAQRTTYNGIEFRSKLETRWARFLDLLEWDARYEPVKADGWWPDFGLRSEGPWRKPVLCEVKPLDPPKTYRCDEAVWKIRRKLENATWRTKSPAILLFNTPIFYMDMSRVSLGFFLHWRENYTFLIDATLHEVRGHNELFCEDRPHGLRLPEGLLYGYPCPESPGNEYMRYAELWAEASADA